jgi:WD40 repeat protein
VHATRLDGRGEPVVLVGHETGVSALAFHPDGRLATAADRTVRLWRMDWQSLVSSLRAATTACLTPEQRVRHLGEASDRARAASDACERRHGRAP